MGRVMPGRSRSGTHGLNEELGRHEGRSACCVVTSVKVSAMCCGSVLPIISVEMISQLLGKGYKIPSLLVVRESLPLCWAVSCGMKTFHHSFSLLRVYFAYFGAKKS